MTHTEERKIRSMEPVNINRHFTCDCYANTDEQGAFVSITLDPNEALELNSMDKLLLVFVQSNDARYSITGDIHATHNSPFGMLMDTNTELKIMLGDGGMLQIFKFEHLTHLCSGFSFNNIRTYAPNEMVHRTIEIYEPLKLVLESMQYYYDDHLRCSEIMEQKLKEVFFVISGYYKPEVIGELLAPLLRREVDFKEFVITNHFKARSVQELAEMRGISIRNFNKTFKETFNMPPYAWMLEEKAKMIEERLSDPTISFQEIMEEFQFSSPSHFTVFCKRQFGKTPTQRRRELIREEAERRAALRRANNPMYYK